MSGQHCIQPLQLRVMKHDTTETSGRGFRRWRDWNNGERSYCSRILGFIAVGSSFLCLGVDSDGICRNSIVVVPFK